MRYAKRGLAFRSVWASIVLTPAATSMRGTVRRPRSGHIVTPLGFTAMSSTVCDTVERSALSSSAAIFVMTTSTPAVGYAKWCPPLRTLRATIMLAVRSSAVFCAVLPEVSCGGATLMSTTWPSSVLFAVRVSAMGALCATSILATMSTTVSDAEWCRILCGSLAAGLLATFTSAVFTTKSLADRLLTAVCICTFAILHHVLCE